MWHGRMAFGLLRWAGRRGNSGTNREMMAPQRAALILLAVGLAFVAAMLLVPFVPRRQMRSGARATA